MSPLSLLIFLLPSAIASVETLNTNDVPSLFNPKLPPRTLSSSKKFKGSSDLVRLRYQMGPVLSSNPINIYIIWYGRWVLPQKLLIKDFLLSISTTDAPSPSVAQWWRTVSLYTDQTCANVSRSVVVAGSETRLSSAPKFAPTLSLFQDTWAEVVRELCRRRTGMSELMG